LRLKLNTEVEERENVETEVEANLVVEEEAQQLKKFPILNQEPL
jgi:hypothetical protein